MKRKKTKQAKAKVKKQPKQKELFTKKVVEKKVKIKTDPFDALFTRWKAGEQIMALAAESSIKRSKLRRNLIRLAGGKDGFKALRASGAGGTSEPFGGKRAVRVKGEAVATAWDDSKVKHIPHKERLKRWKTERFWSGGKESREIFVNVAPDGQRYVRAKDNEKADLIFDWPIKDENVMNELAKQSVAWRIRMKLEAKSGLLRALRREKEELKRGEQALEKTRATKREKRQLRKARKHK